MLHSTSLAFGTSNLFEEIIDQRTVHLFTSLLEYSNDHFFILPAPATHFSYVTPATVKLLGYEMGDFRALPVKTFVSPSSLVTICDALHRAAASEIAIDGIITLIPYPIELIKKDKSIVLGKIRCVLLMTPEHTVVTIGGRVFVDHEVSAMVQQKTSSSGTADSSAVQGNPNAAVRQGRILIMDDEDILIDIALQMGKRLGLVVEAVKNSVDAIEKYRDAFILGHPYDAVLLDMTISGGIGGVEVSKELHRINPDVKTIVMSGYADHDVMLYPDRYGFTAVITKPFRMAEFRDVIQQVAPSEQLMHGNS